MHSFSANQTPVICSRVLLVYLSRESHCLPELSRDVQWNTSRTNMVRKGEKMSIFNSTTSKRVSILSFDNVKQSYLLATGCSIVFSRSDGELSHGINEKFRKKSFKNITPHSHRQPQPLSDHAQNLDIDGDRYKYYKNIQICSLLRLNCMVFTKIAISCNIKWLLKKTTYKGFTDWTWIE